MNLSLDSLLIPKEDLPRDSFAMYRMLWAEQDNPLHNTPLRLDVGCKGVRVIAGCMWVTLDGEDYIVETEMTFRFPVHGHQALISNAGQFDLIFELL